MRTLKSDQSYQDRVQFDIPRHRLYLGFKQDWPRMNAVPEWFTVEPDEDHRYAVENIDTGSTRVHTGKSLPAPQGDYIREIWTILNRR